MRHTFVSTALGLVLPSLFDIGFAGELLKRNNTQTCTIDPVYKGLWSNPEIAYDATTWCLSALGSTTATTCLATTTSRTTEFPMASDTITVTETTAVPSSTVTVTSTAVVFGIGLNTTSTVGSSTTSAMPRYPRANIGQRLVSSISYSSVDLTASLVSACTCNSKLSAETSSIICTSISTVYNSVITHTTTTEFVTLSSGVTTITEAANSTTSILPTSVSMNGSTWTVTMTSSTDSSNMTQMSPSTMTSSSASSPTAQPSGCPTINGTTYNTGANPCSYYERVCYQSYAASSFYDTEENFDTAEECAQLCDASNRGRSTQCVGIVWNTTSSGGANCRQLKSTSAPINETDSIALLLTINPNCSTTSLATSVVSSTASTENSTTPISANLTTTSSSNVSSAATTASITQESADRMLPHFPSSANNTKPMKPSKEPNHSWGTWAGWSGSVRTGTGTVMSTMTSNTTCPASTVYSSITIYATQFATVTPSMNWNETVTVYGNSTTVTLTTDAGSNLTVTKTETSTATYYTFSTITAPCTTSTKNDSDWDRVAPETWKAISLGH